MKNQRFTLKCFELHNRKKQVKAQITKAHKTMLALKDHTRKQMEFKFRNVHAIIKTNHPISDYKWLNALDRAKGLEHSTTYDNLTAATLFLEFISLVEKEKFSSSMREIKFYSLTMDGSTDNSVTEQETLFVRWCKNGKIVTRFLCIGEPNSTTSKDLLLFVKQKLEESELSSISAVLVGFGCDGASNMMGKNSGLVALLKVEHPEIIGIHCLAHRLELAFKDVFKNDKLYLKLTTLLLGLYYFYKNSTKQRKNLKTCMALSFYVKSFSFLNFRYELHTSC